LEGEIICKEYSKKGLSVSIIRPRTILGHGRLGIFSILFRWVSEGVSIPVLDNGDNIYQFVHADDLADACILAGNNDQVFSSYNIGGSEYGTMRSTLENLCEYAATGSRVYSLPLRPIEVIMNITSKIGLTPLAPYHSLMYGRSLYFNIDKAKEELGFLPKYTTNNMFCESYDWFINNYESINNSKDASPHRKLTREALLKVFRFKSLFDNS